MPLTLFSLEAVAVTETYRNPLKYHLRKCIYQNLSFFSLTVQRPKVSLNSEKFFHEDFKKQVNNVNEPVGGGSGSKGKILQLYIECEYDEELKLLLSFFYTFLKLTLKNDLQLSVFPG